MKPRSVVTTRPVVREGNRRGGTSGVGRQLLKAVVLDESTEGSLIPRKSNVCLSSVPACPSIHCHPKEAGGALGEQACCGLCHLCPAALGSKPVTCQPSGPQMPGLKGYVQNVSWGQRNWALPRVPPSPWKGTPPLHREGPMQSPLSLGNISCFPPL